MLKDTLEKLQDPYTAAELADATRLATRLHVDAPRTRELVNEIFVDFDEEKLGIGWWAPGPGTRRRILIADQLFLCVGSIEKNLLEARVHLMEAAQAAEDRDRLLVGAVRSTGGRVHFRLPAPRSPVDDLTLARLDMHVVGCVRALASAFDCLGATIVGVLAMPVRILTAGYREAAKCASDGNKRDPFQVQHWKKLDEHVSAAGPTGWVDWVLGFRNMLVHRGRRMAFAKVMPAGGPIVVPGGSDVHPSRAVNVLPADPGRSDVEVMRDASPAGLVLSEDAFETLEGALESTLSAVEGSCSVLRAAWVERRSASTRLPQPMEQWPNVDSTGDAFVGYRPGSVPFDPTELHGDAVLVKRLRAASLEDAVRGRWSSFD